MDELGIEENGYLLATAHIQEKVDDPVRLAGILEGLKIVGEEFGVDVIYPLHKRQRPEHPRLQMGGVDSAG